MSARCGVIGVLALLCLGHGSASTVTPVQKVLEMLGEMTAKGEAALVEEQKTFQTYANWVDDTSFDLSANIKTATSTIEELLAFIAKADSDVKKLGKEIAELENEITAHQTELAGLTTTRNEERAAFETQQQDYSESVDALARAIQVLGNKGEGFDRAQAEGLLQNMAVNNMAMQRVLAAFLQQKTSQDGAPAVNAYETQSGGILNLLEELHDKFSGELGALQRAEKAAQQQYDLVKIDLTDAIKYATKEVAEKSARKSSTASDSAKAKGDLAQTRADKAADEATLSETKATFQAKSAAFAENQKVRKMELEALKKATEIIASPTVADSYATHINFLQVSSARSRVSAKQRVAMFLKKRAAMLSSKTLESLANEVEGNPFAKVINMIKDLLTKLKEEAAEEADHKQWCDEQLKANKLKREKKSARVDALSSQIESQAAKIAEQATEIATLIAEQEELTKQMAKATEVRDKEKAFNLKSIKDAQAGAVAVKKALVVLKDFYSAQSFVQQVPEMAEYKGMQGAKGGVVGMLEVIVSDFEREAAEHQADEAASAAEYKTFMADSKASKKAKHDAEFKLKLEKDQTEFEKKENEEDRASTQTELDKANEYYDELKPACLEVHVSYEERVAQRKQEIESLKQAYEILSQKGA